MIQLRMTTSKILVRSLHMHSCHEAGDGLINDWGEWVFGPGSVSSPLATSLLTDHEDVEFVASGDSVVVDAMATVATCMGLSALIKPEGPLPVIHQIWVLLTSMYTHDVSWYINIYFTQYQLFHNNNNIINLHYIHFAMSLASVQVMLGISDQALWPTSNTIVSCKQKPDNESEYDTGAV